MRLNEDHRAFRDSVRRFVDTEVNPHVDAWEAAGRAPLHDLFPKAAALGLLGLEYDPEYGGQGADHLFTVIMCEELTHSGAAGIPMAIGVQTCMATPSLAHFGSDELKRKYLAPAIAGEMVCSIAVTESGAGSDVASIRTKAVRDGDEWVINGSKLYITNGTQADWLCVLARTSDEGGYQGMSQLVVPTDRPGFAVSRKLDKLGMRASDTAELTFEELRVPADHLIGVEGRGFQQQMRQFQNERMIAAYNTLGATKDALARTRVYLTERRAFGAPLLANQFPQFTLAELAAEVRALEALSHACVEDYVAGFDTSRDTTICKLLAGKLIRKVADWCLQFHGGIGYMEETRTARFYRDARLWAIGGGADEVMLRTLARADGFSAD
jgi:citronellyl-CoA dehydrogenase